MKLITISGLDGSGKSTQIKFLKEYLESQGEKVFYFHSISFSLPNKILGFLNVIPEFFRKKNVRDPDSLPAKHDNVEQNSVTSASWLGILLRKIIFPIDLWRFKLLLNKLGSKDYKYILSDRYFYDTVVNIEYLSGKNLKYIPKIIKPDIAIYLQADPQAIMTRSKKIPDQGLKFLEDKKMILDKKTELWNWTILNNTDMDKFETSEEIKKIIEK